MIAPNTILHQIKTSVSTTASNAEVILYGSRARGDNRDDSDFDILILLNQETISREDEQRIKYPLYDIEFETGFLISPLVLSKQEWEQKHRITPFYENIVKDGIVL